MKEIPNPNTAGDPAWAPLASTRAIPGLPSYPTGYAAAGYAGAEVLKLLCRADRVAFKIQSYSLTGGDRSYSSFY